MSTILTTTIAGKNYYLMSTSVRTFDNRKLINLTDKLEKAKEFKDDADAMDYISHCITNGRKYKSEPLQTV